MAARLLFSNSSLVSITLQPSEKGWKTILLFATRLTQEAAVILKAGHFFRSNGDPVENVSSFALDVTLRDVDLCIPSPTSEGVFDNHRPDLIYKFRTSEVTESKIDIQFRVHFTGINRDLIDFAESVGKDDFELAIRSLQEEFDFSGENPGGTQAVMSGDKEDEEDEPGDAEASGPLFSSCVHCDSEMALNEDGTAHVDSEGEVIPCTHPSAKAVKGDNAPLPTAQSMGAGRGKKKRGRVIELPTAEEAEDAVTVN